MGGWVDAGEQEGQGRGRTQIEQGERNLGKGTRHLAKAGCFSVDRSIIFVMMNTENINSPED